MRLSTVSSPSRIQTVDFGNATMRHLEACQIDPLAVDQEIMDEYGLEVYHSAQVAFNMLLRIRNAGGKLTLDKP